MRIKHLPIMTAAGLAFGIVLLAGCQSPGALVSLKDSSVCPECKMQTTTSALKGLNLTKHICPTCETRYDHTYTGDTELDPEVVHTCANCESLVENCPQCLAQADQ